MKSFEEFDPLMLTLGKRSASCSSLYFGEEQDDEALVVVSRKRQRVAPRRCVRFNDAATVSHANTQVDRDEFQQQWYSVADYDRFRQDAASVIRNCILRQHQQRQKQQQQQVTTAAPIRQTNFSRVLQRTYQACAASSQGMTEADILSAQERTELGLLFQQPQSDNADDLTMTIECLGLERAIARSVGKDRAVRRKQCQEAVTGAQKDGQWHDADTLAVALRLRCEAISWTSTMFAQCLARASYACGN